MERLLVNDMPRLTSECSIYSKWKPCATRCPVTRSVNGRSQPFPLTIPMWVSCDKTRRSSRTSKTRMRCHRDRVRVCGCAAPHVICGARPKFLRNRSCFSRQSMPIKTSRTSIARAVMRICYRMGISFRRAAHHRGCRFVTWIIDC